MTPARASALALAAGLAACDCGGGEPWIWVAERDAARVVALRASGLPAHVAAAPPAIDTPVRALLRRSDGAVVVLQEPEGCAGGRLDPVADACVPGTAARVAVPPVLLLTRFGARSATLPATDGAGAPLFTAAAPPWAAAEDPAGRTWVTGRRAPVVYGRDGGLALSPQPLDFPTRGVAPLADGRVVVSYGVQDLAVYDPEGAVTLRVTPALGPEYEGIDALAAEPGGTLLVATRRYGVSSRGVVLRGRLEGGALVLVQEPARSAGLEGGVPSGLALVEGRVLTAPALGRLAPPSCGRWLSADLTAELGCVLGAAHRAVAWLP